MFLLPGVLLLAVAGAKAAARRPRPSRYPVWMVVRLPGDRSREPEVRKRSLSVEAREMRDVVAVKRQHKQANRPADVGVRILGVVH
jgi:hypothetical protein